MTPAPAEPPPRSSVLPYGKQWIDDEDIAAVVEVLRSDWLTTGPKVEEFEAAFAEKCHAQHAVAVSSGTAALHVIMHGIGVGPGDEVIVPAITFVASANCAVYMGATPVFADVQRDTLLIDPDSVASLITERTKAIVAVDYAGQPCEYHVLRALANEYGLHLITDACHSAGATYRGEPVGSVADASAFSFHPVKHITTGEGGIVTTNDSALAERMRKFRSHGIAADFRQREARGAWHYEMVELGFNYRITDFQCALGLSQLRKLSDWVRRRQEIAAQYNATLKDMPGIEPLLTREEVSHAYHLYVIRCVAETLGRSRDEIFTALRNERIGVNVHYMPVYLHPFYRERFGYEPGLCPNAEAVFSQILSLPIFPRMTDQDVRDVIAALTKTTQTHA